MIGTIIDLVLICSGSYSGVTSNNQRPPQQYQYQPSQYNGNYSYEDEPEYRTTSSGMTWTAGSNKQIDWADRLVNKYVKDATNLIITSYQSGRITEQEGQSLASIIGQRAEKVDDANWWIDNRQLPTKQITRLLLENDYYYLEIVNRLVD